MKKSYAFLAFGLAFLGPVPVSHANVVGGVDPSYVKVKVYEIRLFQDANCSGGGLSIYSNAAPSYQDMANSPTLGSGAIPNGTYQCLAMKMSDQIHVSPVSATGPCAVGSDYVQDVAHDDTAIDPDGTQHVLGAPGTEDIVWLYVRIGGNNSNNGNQHSWQPTGGIPLTSPLVVSGNQSRTMVFDFSNRIGNDGGQCSIDAPTLSFR
jgi:hypothetical protein